MSFRGNLLRAGIDSDGKVVTVYRNDGRLDVSTRNSDTTGTIRSAILTHTEGADSLTKITEVMKVILDSEYTTGDWVNAIVGRIDYGSAGDAKGGMAAAVCAEVNLPGKGCESGSGAIYPLDLEIEAPTSYVSDANPATPIAFMKFGLWGGAKAQVDSGGYLFHTSGLTAGSGKILSENSRTLKVDIEGTAKYLYLSDTEDDLGTMVVDSISLQTAVTTAINVSGVCTGNTSNGLLGSAILQHGSYTTPVAHGSITATHLVLQSIHISIASTGQYVFGNLCRLDTSGTTTGHLIGHYGYIYHGAYACGDSYAVRGRIDITATAALGLADALMGEVNITAGTVTGSSGASINGLHIDVNVTAGATVAQEIHGILINTSGIAVDTSGDKIALKIEHAGGSNYLDYAIHIGNCLHNATAAIFIQATQGDLACGIKFDAGGHTMTTALSFNATAAITYFADFTGTTGANGTCYEDDANAATNIEGKIMCLDKDGNKIYINCYRTEN